MSVEKFQTNPWVAPLLSSSAEGTDLEKKLSHHFQFAIERVMLKERRKLSESISPWRCVIALCYALVSSKASCYCASWCIHAWRFPKSKATDVVQTRRISWLYHHTASPESPLYEWSCVVKKSYIFPIKIWFAGTGKKYSMCCIVMGQTRKQLKPALLIRSDSWSGDSSFCQPWAWFISIGGWSIQWTKPLVKRKPSLWNL